MKRVVVVGSSNVDMIMKVPHLPKPGETVGGGRFMQVFGGKGANQAVAAARLGASVVFVTSVGNDAFADELLEHFRSEGISTGHTVRSGKPTGTALILVGEDAQNCIAVAPGANGELLPGVLPDLNKVLDGADIVAMQAEIPYETIREVAFAARAKGVKVMLNPAPACAIDSALMKAIDILVVNEIEAEMVSGIPVGAGDPAPAASRLREMGAGSVVITLGEKGAYCQNREAEYTVPAFSVAAVDTTAAGDTFCGALAVACAGRPVDKAALEFASAAAAIAVTRMGAQPSIPSAAEVDEFLRERAFVIM